MKAVVITRFGGPEVLEIRDVAKPEPGPDEILVHVRSSALNRAGSGFADQSHLSRVFKQHTGMLPGELRSLLRRGN